MQLTRRDNLLFTPVTLTYQGTTLEVVDLLVDTGSATTLLAADRMAEMNLWPAPYDNLYTIRGVGGTEFVFARQVDRFSVGERSLLDFEIKIGEVDYGFGINGVLGMDFLYRTGAVIDLNKMTLTFS